MKTKTLIKHRYITVLPEDIGKSFMVHTGRDFKEIKITSEKVGKKFGEFVGTKTPAIWKKHDKKR